MAFCPNCGTANTEQADKCVSCGFALTPTPQKARFKGTIMMSGSQLPAGVVPQAAPPAAAPPAAPPASANAPQVASGQAPAKQFARTMLGAAISSPLAPPAGAPAPSPAAKAPPAAAPPREEDLASAATMHGAAVPYARTVEAPQLSLQPTEPAPAEPPTVPAAVAPAVIAAARPPEPAAALPAPPRMPTMAASTSTYGSDVSSGTARSVTGNSLPPAKAGVGKAVFFGCAGALAVAAIGAFALYMFAKSKITDLISEGSEQSTVAWQQSVGQAVVQVAQICAQDCNAAAIYFHPQTQAALLPEAKQLTPARAQKLTSAGADSARMLNDSDDAAVATKLNLDPARCVLLTLGQAKVVGCSVIDDTGADSLRLVHLAGIETL